jgi:hypothetical protein
MRGKVTRDFARKNQRFLILPIRLIPRNRSGSHVGVILSFVIFVTFIVFLYTVIRPAVTTGENKRTILTYIENKIEENSSAEFTSISIMISENSNRYCIKLEDFFLYSMVSAHLIAKNEIGNVEDAYYNPVTDLDDLRIDRDNKNNLFFKIYYSPEFDNLSAADAGECELVRYGPAYEITSVDSDAYIFEKNIYELIDYYNSNYEKLKSEFNIPSGSEFEFTFTQSNGTKLGNESASKSINVYAEETPVQYIDSKANILSGFINVRVW